MQNKILRKLKEKKYQKGGFICTISKSLIIRVGPVNIDRSIDWSI